MTTVEAHELLPDETPKPARKQRGYKLIAEEQASHQAWLDGQPMTVRCAVCPWTFEGTAAEARVAGVEHRQGEHPELRKGRLSDERKREIAAEKRRVEQQRADTARARRQRPPRVVQPRRSHGAVKRGPAPVLTKEEAHALLHAYVREHGHVPQAKDMKPSNGLPSAGVCDRLSGSFANFVEEAGYERPYRGRRRHASPAPPAPPAAAPEPVEEPVAATYEPDPGWPAGFDRVARELAETRSMTIDEARAAVLLAAGIAPPEPVAIRPATRRLLASALRALADDLEATGA